MPAPLRIASETLMACSRGDERAQEIIYRACFSRLLPICLRYLGDRPTAVSVLNQAMVKVFKLLPEYREEGKLEAWLTTIVRNTILSYIRDERRAQRRMLDRAFVWPASVPNRALSELAVEDILKLLERLPDHLRVVFNLVVFDDYSHAEVARELDITEQASRWRLGKARKLLQGHYRQTHEEIDTGS